MDSDLRKPKQQPSIIYPITPQLTLREIFLRNSRRRPTNLGGPLWSPSPASKLQYPLASQFPRVA